MFLLRQRQLFPTGYTPALDGLRGIAILLVMLSHAWPEYMGGGFIGVDIFFVLSGYLITESLLQSYGKNGNFILLSQFYKRRALRLLPALWLMAVTMLLIGYKLWPNRHELWLGFLSGVLYVGNWTHAYNIPMAPFMGNCWSLATEEQFYLIWPALFLLFMANFKWQTIAFSSCGLAMGLVLWRVYLSAVDAPTVRIYSGLDTHADGLLIGCALSLFSVTVLKKFFGKVTDLIVWPILLGLAAFTIFGNYGHWKPWIWGVYFFANISIAFLLLEAVTKQSGAYIKILSIPPLVYTGRISYGLYLWHLPVACVLYLIHCFSSEWNTWIAIVLAFLLASASYFLLEQPILELRYKHAKDRVSYFGLTMGVIGALGIIIGCFALLFFYAL